MKTMEKKKELKRKAIVSAAQETFRLSGYIGSSMDVIAGKAGVTKQTLYRYFQTKELLFKASLEARREENQNLFLEGLNREDPGDGLTLFAVGFLKVHMSEDHLAGVRLLLAEGERVPAIARAHFEGGPQKINARLALYFKERFRIDDPEFAAKAFISTLLIQRMNIMTGLRKAPSQEELEGHARQTVQLFLKLLK